MIHFFCEDIDFQTPTPKKLKNWLKQVVLCEHRQLGVTNYIFCNDAYLLRLNRQYLGHDTLTDIITFDQSEDPLTISGDIYISLERVRENAQKFKVDVIQELKRVMIHGILHLIGYDDKSPEQRQEMRKKEEAYLSL